MIKAILFVGLGLLFSIYNVEAKRMDSQEYAPMYERIGNKKADKMLKRMDPTGSKMISLEQFKGQNLSRGERREIRNEQKRGTYKSPEEEFKIIDKNTDGMLSADELRSYYAKKAEERYGK